MEYENKTTEVLDDDYASGTLQEFVDFCEEMGIEYKFEREKEKGIVFILAYVEEGEHEYKTVSISELARDVDIVNVIPGTKGADLMFIVARDIDDMEDMYYLIDVEESGRAKIQKDNFRKRRRELEVIYRLPIKDLED